MMNNVEVICQWFQNLINCWLTSQNSILLIHNRCRQHKLFVLLAALNVIFSIVISSFSPFTGGLLILQYVVIFYVLYSSVLKNTVEFITFTVCIVLFDVYITPWNHNSAVPKLQSAVSCLLTLRYVPTTTVVVCTC